MKFQLTFVTTSNELAAIGTSLTELRRRIEERLDKNRIDLQCDYDDLDEPGMFHES